jgi:dipeptidyl aminopeptidase/acylaminoacyl peptidase
MLRLFLAALLVASVLPTTGSARLDARRPGRPLLTYVPRSGGLCLVRPDGSHRVRLLTSPVDVYGPAWSPGGRYVAFNWRPGVIAFANARGRVLWRIARAGVGFGGTVWSPDGRHIAHYVGSTGPPYWYELVIARPSGAHEVRIGGSMDPAGDANYPVWALDSEHLAFDGVEHTQDAVPSIFSIPVEGGDWRLLVRSAEHPAYSADGSKLAYAALDERFHSDSVGIYVADANGGNPRMVAAGPAVYWPTWSPDGSLIAFERLDVTNGRGWEVVVAKADGTGEHIVASGLAFPQGPSPVVSWSPGGRLLAFYKGDRSLVVANADGTGMRVVARHVRLWTDYAPPAWRPAVALSAATRRRC